MFMLADIEIVFAYGCCIVLHFFDNGVDGSVYVVFMKYMLFDGREIFIGNISGNPVCSCLFFDMYVEIYRVYGVIVFDILTRYKIFGVVV